MTFTPPIIEKNVPLPRARVRVEARGRPLAPWVRFLAGLEPGDSFRILATSEACLRNHARRLRLRIVTQSTGQRADFNSLWLRVWVAKF